MSNLAQFYSEPMQVVNFLVGDRTETVMKLALRKAKEQYERYGISPIVKQSRDGIYGIDYFFLVGAFVDYVYTEVDTKMSHELAVQLAELLKRDFGSEASKKNIALLINLFDFNGKLRASSDRKWTYTLQRYYNKNNGKRFLLSVVLLNAYWVKELDEASLKILQTVTRNDNLELEVVGPKAFELGQNALKDGYIYSFMNMNID